MPRIIKNEEGHEIVEEVRSLDIRISEISSCFILTVEYFNGVVERYSMERNLLNTRITTLANLSGKLVGEYVLNLQGWRLVGSDRSSNNESGTVDILDTNNRTRESNRDEVIALENEILDEASVMTNTTSTVTMSFLNRENANQFAKDISSGKVKLKETRFREDLETMRDNLGNSIDSIEI